MTLLYDDDDFCLGARVLGQTLLDTGTTKDRVAMCTDAVSKKTRDILRYDGWIIKPVSTIRNPNKNRFSGCYSKLHAWTMTEYERLVYLDADEMSTLYNSYFLHSLFS